MTAPVLIYAKLFLATRRGNGDVTVFEVPDDGDTIRRAALEIRRYAIADAQETARLLAPITPCF